MLSFLKGRNRSVQLVEGCCAWKGKSTSCCQSIGEATGVNVSGRIKRWLSLHQVLHVQVPCTQMRFNVSYHQGSERKGRMYRKQHVWKDVQGPVLLWKQYLIPGALLMQSHLLWVYTTPCFCSTEQPAPANSSVAEFLNEECELILNHRLASREQWFHFRNQSCTKLSNQHHVWVPAGRNTELADRL